MTTFTDELSAALFNAITLKYNENHDELGRFSESDSGGASSGSSRGGKLTTSEGISNIVRMKPIETLHVIEHPNGRFGYAGKVPVKIGYIDATPEKIEAAKFGARFGPKMRTFASREEAIQYAKDNGFDVMNDKKTNP